MSINHYCGRIDKHTFTWDWIFHQVEDGAWFIISIEAQSIITIWQLKDEVWVSINCHSFQSYQEKHDLYFWSLHKIFKS